MRKQMSRILALLLAAAMMLSLVACGTPAEETQATTTPTTAASTPTTGSDENVTPTEGEKTLMEQYRLFEEPVTLTMAGMNTSAYVCDWTTEGMAELAKMEEVFGIKFEGQNYSGDAWPTQLTMMLTNDTLPDLLVNANMGGNADVYGADGYLLNMMDYIDYMPNLQKLWAEYPALKAQMLATDGGLYSLGKVVLDPYASSTVPSLLLNNEWLDRLDLEVPTTTDELLEVLRAFRDLDADGDGEVDDEIPLGAMDDWSATYLRRVLMAGFGMVGKGMGKNDTGNFNFYVDDNGKVGLYETTDNYKAYLQYWNTLYEEGLLDPEFFIMTSAQFNEKMKAYGTYGMVSYTAHNEDNMSHDHTAVAGLTSQWNDTPFTVQEFTFLKGNIAINALTEYPEELCRFVDFFLSQECADTFYENLNFAFMQSDIPGYEEYTVRSRDPLCPGWGIEPKESWAYMTTHVVIQNAFHVLLTVNTQFYGNFNHEQMVQLYDDYLKLNKEGALAASGSVIAPPTNMAIYTTYSREDMEYVAPYPSMAYTVDEQEARSRIMTDLCSFMNTKCAAFILGNEDIESGYEAFVNELYKMGLQELLDIEQQAYDRNNK